MRRVLPTLVVLLSVLLALDALVLGARPSARAQSATQDATEVANAAEQKPAEPEQRPEQASQPGEQRAPEQRAERTPAQGEPTAEQAAKVDFSGYAPGTIVVETSERKLHLVLENGEVITYPVGVGKAGKNWAGTGAISGKFLHPAWSPPRRLKMEKPWTPDYIPGGSPKNPMGAAAMTLNIDQYAIHGTNDPGSIGGFVSFGCIRMHNHDILDLFKRVKVGTKVVVLK